MKNERSYEGLRHLTTFEERFEFLALRALVGAITFGFERYVNQLFYRSKEWRDTRHYVLARDGARDLGIEGYDIISRPIIHHIIPMTVEDLEAGNPMCLDPDNLITTTHNTHNAIHYGDKSLLNLGPISRRHGDTRLW